MTKIFVHNQIFTQSKYRKKILKKLFIQKFMVIILKFEQGGFTLP